LLQAFRVVDESAYITVQFGIPDANTQSVRLLSRCYAIQSSISGHTCIDRIIL
jgi:hypothetical protein